MPHRTLHTQSSLLYRISGSGLVIGFCAVVVALNCALALHKLSQDRMAVQREAASLANRLAMHMVVEITTLIQIGDMALGLLAKDHPDSYLLTRTGSFLRNPLFVGSPVMDIWQQSPAATPAFGLGSYRDDNQRGHGAMLLLSRPLPPDPQGNSRSGHVVLNFERVNDFIPQLPRDYSPLLTLYDRDGTAIYADSPANRHPPHQSGMVIANPDWENSVVARERIGDTGLTAEVRLPRDVIDHHASLSLLSMIPYALAQTAAVLFCGALALNRIRREHEAVTALQNAHDTLEERVAQRTSALESINHQLDAALRDKDILLREVKHRVLNNLQVVNSLLRLQAGRMPESARHGFAESQRRLGTLTLLQGRLMSSPRPGRVEMSSLLRELGHTTASQKQPAPVDLHLDLNEWWLDADTASPVLLIADEALSNAFAHAFVPAFAQTPPTITGKEDHHDAVAATGTVRLENGLLADGRAWLRIRDDGRGFAPDQPDGLGLTLIRMLARQLRAELDLRSGPHGTEITLTLPAADAA